MFPLPTEASLYVHIPFCSTICPFCDFTKLNANTVLYDDYIHACCHEIQSYNYDPSIRLTSIFFGGGTPSVLSMSYLEQLMTTINNTFNNSSIKEITIEINPEDVSYNYLLELKQLGFTRLSLGVQTFNHNECQFLGRGHTVEQSYQALELIKQFTFDLNIDLLFGLPNSSLDHLQNSVHRALEYQPNHVSCYSLTIEPNTPFFKKKVQKASDDHDFNSYLFLIDFLTDHGFCHYEVSSFAKPAYQCIHNKRYWDFDTYIGVGLGAHSFISPYRYHNKTSLNDYIRSPTPTYFLSNAHALSRNDLIKENIIANLRVPKGIVFSDYQDRYNFSFEHHFSHQINTLIAENLIQKTNFGIQTTKKGLYLLDNVCLSFL
ncbi:hypothetical protein DID74_00960 [Candidatus Marinamargulisbacteria bacterium SCGC AG-333-B06]|nr:hypothetical protein DID74_00960 [Candidatus Marinamargulisbacteria bacterium SCGC AG-333-B06]